jgi:hypothetical protein
MSIMNSMNENENDLSSYKSYSYLAYS